MGVFLVGAGVGFFGIGGEDEPLIVLGFGDDTDKFATEVLVEFVAAVPGILGIVGVAKGRPDLVVADATLFTSFFNVFGPDKVVRHRSVDYPCVRSGFSLGTGGRLGFWATGVEGSGVIGATTDGVGGVTTGGVTPRPPTA